MLDIASLRKNYSLASLDEIDVLPSPIAQFAVWFGQAKLAQVPEPNAFTLASSSIDGIPNARIVLLKDVTDAGFTFYTNYQSQKSRELIANPLASMCFLWHELERQVRVKGHVSKVSREVSRAYFHSRPRASQLGAWTSPQSDVIVNAAYLSEQYAHFDSLYPEGTEIPLPDHWGGFLITPYEIEFWQGRPSRLHDRISYSLDDNNWSIVRLAP